jgi:hypothetical protein
VDAEKEGLRSVGIAKNEKTARPLLQDRADPGIMPRIEKGGIAMAAQMDLRLDCNGSSISIIC